MLTDNSVPYPRPNYQDKDLLTKELINGTFGIAIFADLKSFKPPMDRYNVTEDDLTDKSLLHGNIQPQDYDITMGDVSLDGVKETGWLPAKRDENNPEPIVIYDPKKHYVFVEWVGINSTDLQNDIPSSNNETYLINVPYYDDDNAGIFGFKTIKDNDGNITDRYAVFYNLKTLSLHQLGRLPNGYDLTLSQYVGYVKGAYIIEFYGAGIISFTLDGGVHILNFVSDFYTPLGDDGVIAIENNILTKTLFFDNTLTQIQEIDGRFCVKSGSISTGVTKYPFGTKIDDIYFFYKDAESSYKFKNTRNGWVAKETTSNTWKFAKRIKYDYATDNWLHTPLKTLKYNTIKQGLYVPNRFPKHEDTDVIEFPNSDMYGDFSRVVKADGSRAYFHTFDFKKFDPLTGDATLYLYGCQGRMWTKDRIDGVSGLMPYTVEIKSVSDFLGSKKTVLQYSGFIFRGGQ